MTINWFMALATPNSWAAIWLASSLSLLAGANPALAGPSPTEAEFAAYAQKSFQEAQARYQKAPGETNAAWQFGRACFDLAEFATNNSERAALAEQGIAACRSAIERDSNSAPAHYYLGMDLGQLARTRRLSALGIVSEMQREFARAHALDERLDWAGPDRNLGLLYRDAPRILSVGSRVKARKHLVRAAELAPAYPENRLNLIESYLEWGEPNNARRQLTALEELLPSARTNFVGKTWAASWADWEQRLKACQKKLGQSAKALGAPRTKD